MISRWMHHGLSLATCAAVCGPAVATSGAQGTLDEYVYAVPDGWSAQRYPDGITLTSPMSATGERCLIRLR
jgi:hypothetical protein